MTSFLQQPVEFGVARLAPTSELAGLAELAALVDDEARLLAIMRIARAIRDEDAERAHIDRIRREDRPLALPRRAVGSGPWPT